jgi:hypothetical protein
MEITVIASSSIDEGIGSWDLKTGTEQLQFKPCASPAHGLTAVGEKFLASSQLSARNTSGSIFYWSWTKVSFSNLKSLFFCSLWIESLKLVLNCSLKLK